MKYLVMECNLSYAVVLDEQGRFKKVANMNYEVGQTITDIVEMQPKLEKKGVNIRTISSLVALAACLMIMISSLFYLTRTPYASVYLSINPRVRIDVNENDKAIGLEGINADGKELVDGYSYKNKELDLVIDELVDRAITHGYLSSGKTITLTLDSEHEEWEISTSEKLNQHLEEYLSDKVSVIIEVETKHNGTQSTPEPTEEPMNPIVIPIEPTESAKDESPTAAPTMTPTPTPTKAPVMDGDSEYEAPNGESNYMDSADDDNSVIEDDDDMDDEDNDINDNSDDSEDNNSDDDKDGDEDDNDIDDDSDDGEDNNSGDDKADNDIDDDSDEDSYIDDDSDEDSYINDDSDDEDSDIDDDNDNNIAGDEDNDGDEDDNDDNDD